MKNKTTISILICLSAILVSMSMLYWTSPLGKKLEPSSFSRNFVPITVTQQTVLELDNKYSYIAGIDANNVYLGDYQRPYLLIKCDKDLTRSEKIGLKMHGVDSIKRPTEFKTVIDSPYFYMANGVMPIVLRGKIGNWTAAPFIPYKRYYFTDLLPINQSSLALRSYSTFQKGLQLALLNELDTPYFKFNFDLLKHQQDGIFSVHGYLLPYKQKNKIIYVYAYRNQYLMIDSKLNQHQIKQTIDTFSIAPIRVGTYNNSEHTLSSPQNIINGPSCTDGNRLYINSSLLAQNENVQDFLNSSTIDVYNIDKGEYSFSFHIPYFKKNGLTEMRIIKNNIYAIYKNTIILYRTSNE